MGLFVGMEETNIDQYESTCCHVGLSIEPLSKVCCGNCGKNVIPNKQYRRIEDKKPRCSYCGNPFDSSKGYLHATCGVE